ncbi:P-type conjugative transfer protein TrbL [Vibrio parahaemolyticus]|uniref:P-type conjugative transfer protein TrbL n=1 Tax=Vibrio parahaemolyticus TaxID=670 RepID=UPI00046EAB36|nr:P-type conjugative transfer protein TrbL [Vibrio parahaemolyticus]EHC7291039.1 P-type conjugative transfer protein TrbL [Vibrio parahaemolyticus]EJE4149868.1 P-type conjugative transfer protein TrbL [Vibrio parahaemolyticus]MBY4654365.1 P-type conjugative transfer protein TrbL [Vibrio parahaemolyticus]MCR9855875.1 P-type conjugative transfer protein TrbL [Vibrio parahaemolyticus]MDK9506294.1 P-type conjugative transfer protein TrbL [Vibrio parahaemolyticus]
MQTNRHNSRSVTKFLTGALSAFFCASSFAADVQQDNTLDTIIATFKSQTTAWEPIIHDLTLSLFWGLVIISFTWTFIQMALKDGVGLVDVIAELTRRVLLIGFSIWMMDNAPDLARTLIKSFTEIGTRISGGAVDFSPSNVLELGINIIGIAWDSTSIGDVGGMLMMFFTSLIIMVCFAIMAMEMTVLIVSGFIIVSGGIVAMGFLGSDWTRDNAINYFTAVLGVAFKMFVMQLVFITGYSFVEAWGAALSADSANTDYLAMVGICIVFAGLIREIPQMASSLASGRFTMAGGGVQSSLRNVGSGVAGAALLAGGAGMAAAYQMMNSAGGSDSDSPTPTGNDEATTNAHTFDTGQGDTSNYMPPEFQQAAAASGVGGSPSNVQAAHSPEPSGVDEAHSQSFDTGQGDNGQAFAESRTESSSDSESSMHTSGTASQSNAQGETAASPDSSPSASAGTAFASSANASPTDSPEVGASSNAPDNKPEPTRTQKALSTVASGAKGLAIGSAKVTGKVAHAGLHAMATRTAFGAMLAEGAKKLGEKPVDMNTAAMEDIARQLNASVTPPPAPTDINNPHFEDYLSPDKSDVKEENQDRESEEKPTQE